MSLPLADDSSSSPNIQQQLANMQLQMNDMYRSSLAARGLTLSREYKPGTLDNFAESATGWIVVAAVLGLALIIWLGLNVWSATDGVQTLDRYNVKRAEADAAVQKRLDALEGRISALDGGNAVTPADAAQAVTSDDA